MTMPINILAGNLVNMLREGNLSFLCKNTDFPGFEIATMKSSDICKGNQIETEDHSGCNVNFFTPKSLIKKRRIL